MSIREFIIWARENNFGRFKYSLIYKLIRDGQIPAHKDSKGRWNVHSEALDKNKLSTFNTENKSAKSAEIAELKKELAETNKRFMDHMMEYAGLRGRHEGLVEVHKSLEDIVEKLDEQVSKSENAINGQQLVIDALKQTIRNREDEIDAGRRIYDDLKSKYDQLVLTTSGLTPLEEEPCQEVKTTSNSIQSMASTRRLRSASGVERKRTR